MHRNNDDYCYGSCKLQVAPQKHRRQVKGSSNANFFFNSADVYSTLLETPGCTANTKVIFYLKRDSSLGTLLDTVSLGLRSDRSVLKTASLTVNNQLCPLSVVIPTNPMLHPRTFGMVQHSIPTNLGHRGLQTEPVFCFVALHQRLLYMMLPEAR
jgi:hypothetical protein